MYPNHPDFIINHVVLNTCESFRILDVLFDCKLTFEQHLRSVSSSSVAHKIGLLSKSYRNFWWHLRLAKVFQLLHSTVFKSIAPLLGSSSAPSVTLSC